jgi:uncharacterized protein YyaL (SSP411 family)
MTVFMTPEGEPFYAGTYFPPEDNFGRPGFPRVLMALNEAWTADRTNLMQTAGQVVEHLKQGATRSFRAGSAVDEGHSATAVERLREAFDHEWAGFGGAPKFPPSGALEFLLARRARLSANGDDDALAMVRHTLDAMWSGGMYDHLGGGFSRYSVDGRWVVPHFEKMLYDNAQLAGVYLHAFLATGEPLYERVCRETLDYLAREMLDPEGGFYSAQDADSEGIEGKYLVWTTQEVEAAVGPDLAPLALAEFGVTAGGNFHDPHHPELTGRSVLTRRAERPLDEREFEAIQARLVAARARRVRPGLDDKILASWNGLALQAFAEAGFVLGEQRYLQIAEANAAFVRERMWRNGRLLHTYKAGSARVPGMLEDYAYYGLGLVALFRATGILDHIEWAREMLQVLLDHFRDAARGGFFDTPDDGEQLLVRNKSQFDASVPSGNGAAARLAFELGRYFGEAAWERLALDTVSLMERVVAEAPTGFGSMLQVLERSLAPGRELVVVGPPEARAKFTDIVRRRFDPHLLLAQGEGAEGLPLFEGRAAGTEALAYLCRDYVCELPARTPEDLAAQLERG